MKHSHIAFLISGVLVLLIGSCNNKQKLAVREPHLPATMYHYAISSVNVIIPPGNPYVTDSNTVPDNTPQSNPTTDAGATLGRVLFYERMFSVNNTISCGSCHKQQYGFADNVAFSAGFNNQKGARNAVAIVNENLCSNFFWDGRASTLEAQDIMPVQNHAELGMENLDNLVVKLKTAQYYPQLFQAAFGTSEVTKQRVVYALAQFMRSMVSFNSKFDQGAASNFANFTSSEKNGELIFRQQRCNSCHGGNNLNDGGFAFEHNMQSGNDWANGGLDPTTGDVGLSAISGRSNDLGVFKIPSLRNVALTGPYMHDGRFKTLDEVVEHYNSGVQANANLDFRLTQGFVSGTSNNAPVRMNLSTQQKADLVAFLNTLTDQSYINDPKFSDPF